MARGFGVLVARRADKLDADRDREVYRYVSPASLDQVVTQLLEFSNNFIANQLLVAAGAAAYGPPATLAKGVKAAKAYCRDILNMNVQLVEGSGLSRKNRLTARQLDRLLAAFAAQRFLMRYEEGEYYKTGTLHGIRTRAGYLEAPDGTWARFAVMCNTPGKETDRIMRRLKAFLAAR